MVDYLASLGHHAKKIKGDDYWYLSPLREERTPSFKIKRNSNIWYDHGTGEGGTLIDFGMRFHKLDIKGFLELLASNYQKLSLSQKRRSQLQQESVIFLFSTTFIFSESMIRVESKTRINFCIYHCKARETCMSTAEGTRYI